MFKMSKDLPRLSGETLDLWRWFTVFILIISVNIVIGNNYYVNQQFIVSKLEYPSNCTDADSVPRKHGENWTSSAGSCDVRICQDVEILKWQINHDCPPEIDFLDVDNCYYKGNSSLQFPACCPILYCTPRDDENVTTAPDIQVGACVDLSPVAACTFWKEMSNCSDSSDGLIQRLYNFTVEFCMATCGFC
ncbi:uncharacterized protein LOC128214784 isoform X1 [Mya arenaria]|uniref:uncharacterized protein LOC128214784 isoform X1 n=1 Tax=Mya arenaria TaxID=6604 RepID=UPI0022E758CA|nr:uncharacterized protein LOC128214784 isoform X1 [Mya arenaria]